MKKSHVIIIMIVVALALPLALYVQAADPTAKVKSSEVAINAPVHKELWNQAGSGFELSSLPNAAEMTAPVQKYLWSHSGGGLTELTSVQTVVEPKVPVQTYMWSHSGGGLTELTTVQTSIPVQKQQWNRFGSGFELSSVRTITEIKASIQKYLWSH